MQYWLRYIDAQYMMCERWTTVFENAENEHKTPYNYRCSYSVIYQNLS
jgi:hypothetical protein